MEGKVCFISDIGNCGWGWGRVYNRPKVDSPALATSGARAFYRQKQEDTAEIAQSSLTVIFKLVIGGLTSVILIVLGTVNL